MSLPNDHTVGTGHAPRLRMPAALLDALRDGLPELAERTVTTVVAEVPAYTNTVGAERRMIEGARTLTAVAVPGGWGVSEAKVIDQRTLEIPEDAVAPLPRPASLLLVPDVGGSARAGYVEAFPVTGSVIGPARPWMQAAVSVRRVERTLAMDIADDRVTDTERHLPELVLGADAQALCDLRARALQPLLAMRPHMRDNLLATLRAWLLHQGSRDAIAAELFVHPQTVRYRMSRLREVYGERLDDPRTVLELTLALGIPRFDGDSSG